MSGQPSFFEIGVPDAGRARTFYATLFGWRFHDMGEGDQAWIETPSVHGGLHRDDPESRIELFFAVPDIEAAVATVRELGGHADDPRPEEPVFGRFAFCRDDQGVRFGLHQAPSD